MGSSFAFLPIAREIVVSESVTVGDIQASCDVSGLAVEGDDADSRLRAEYSPMVSTAS